MRNPRSLPPFQKGELSSSKLNSLRIAASKRIRGLFGRESASSASTSPNKQQSLRERLFAINNTGQSIPPFSIFAIKKSGEIDYAWGPPVRTEGNLFEHGFVYYTNGDFEIASDEGHWCQVVGDLPVLIRNSSQEVPKIGHPIGPFNDGTLSIERCGYVVVAEPWSPGDMGIDDYHVWVTKANDQVIRVKLAEDIAQRARGRVYALNEQNVTAAIRDPNTIAPDPQFEIRKVINLTQQDLKAGDIRYAHPVLGIGYAIIEPSIAIATIVFTMLTDRSRETVGMLNFGRASVRIDDKIGTAPGNIGNIVPVNFADLRWLGAVKGCQGIADYISDPQRGNFWVVKECQELTAGFWFTTLEDRVGTDDQDVLVTLTKNIGHANADFPREEWQQSKEQPPVVDCGYIVFEWLVDQQVWHPIDFSNANDCCNAVWWEFDIPPPENTQLPGQTINWSEGLTPIPGSCGDTQNPQTIKVRYKAGTFPYMLQGAIGFALLDVDITNLTDNSTIRYYVTQSDQRVLYFTAVLQEQMCGTDASIGTNVLGSFFPFGQAPVGVTTVANPRSHYGQAGDTIVAEWFEGTQQWEVVDVTKHPVTVSSITSTTVNGCTTIYSTSQNIAAERCEPAGQTIPLLAYRTQTLTDVTGIRLDKGQTGSAGSEQCDPKLIIDVTQYQGYVICDTPTPTSFELPLLSKTVLISFDADGCPMWMTQQLIVMGICGDARLNEADCDECPT